MPMAERVHASGIMKSIATSSEMTEALYFFMDCVNGADARTNELRQGIFCHVLSSARLYDVTAKRLG
jgi:hypothetical protein